MAEGHGAPLRPVRGVEDLLCKDPFNSEDAFVTPSLGELREAGLHPASKLGPEITAAEFGESDVDAGELRAFALAKGAVIAVGLALGTAGGAHPQAAKDIALAAAGPKAEPRPVFDGGDEIGGGGVGHGVEDAIKQSFVIDDLDRGVSALKELATNAIHRI